MSRLPLLIFVTLLLLAAAPAQADESATASLEAIPAPEASPTDRPSPVDGAGQSPVKEASGRDADLPSRPGKRWATGAEIDNSSYRMSLSRGKLDLGLGFDAPADPATRTARGADPIRPIVPVLPSLSIGLRSVTAGAAPNSLIARAGVDGAGPPSSTRRVGLEWKPAQSGLFVHGGLRLSGDDRVTMKVRGGRVGLYMKSSF